MKRSSIPSATEREVLISSARRCALCFGLHRDFDEKKGQIAHLDKNPANHSLDNLVFLCLPHHDQYDSTSSQSKGYRKPEVISYRQLLHEIVDSNIRREALLEKEAGIEEHAYTAIHNSIDRLHFLGEAHELLASEIIHRAKILFEYAR